MEARERVRVLCVDDEPAVLEGLALHLRRRYDVLTAAGLMTEHVRMAMLLPVDPSKAALAKWYAEDLPGRYPTAEDHRAINNCGVEAG